MEQQNIHDSDATPANIVKIFDNGVTFSAEQPQLQELNKLGADELLKQFKHELKDLFVDGLNYRNEDKQVREKLQGKAITALAKILEIRRTFFESVTPELNEELMQQLREFCKSADGKNGNKKTTVFHLLSRIFRHADRKQASADAIVLQLAYDEGLTGQTFHKWVLDSGGLNNIRINRNKETAQAQPERKVKTEILHKMAKRGNWRDVASLSVEDLPEELEDIMPSDSTWRLLAIQKHEGELRFLHLQEDK